MNYESVLETYLEGKRISELLNNPHVYKGFVCGNGKRLIVHEGGLVKKKECYALSEKLSIVGDDPIRAETGENLINSYMDVPHGKAKISELLLFKDQEDAMKWLMCIGLDEEERGEE